MGARLPEAERLRRHNEEMKLALIENIPLAEARMRLFRERIGATDRARDERIAGIEQEKRERRNERLCGTVDEASRAPFWWERD
jgi:hypothetical protein